MHTKANKAAESSCALLSLAHSKSRRCAQVLECGPQLSTQTEIRLVRDPQCIHTHVRCTRWTLKIVELRHSERVNLVSGWNLRLTQGLPASS